VKIEIGLIGRNVVSWKTGHVLIIGFLNKGGSPNLGRCVLKSGQYLAYSGLLRLPRATQAYSATSSGYLATASF
jgi:hypothetical protein